MVGALRRVETLENTPAVIAELEKRALDGMFTGSHVWSEFEKQCKQDEYFAGTRWTEIVSGVHRDAARFYFREKPFRRLSDAGAWRDLRCTQSQLLSLR